MTYSGAKKTILIGQESTWGTAVTTDKDIGIVQDIKDATERETSEVMGLGKIETQQVNTGNVFVNGGATLKLQHGRLFEYILGSVAHAETTGDWKHTFTVDNSPPSFTIESSEDGSTDTTRKYAGCLVESGEISINNTEELMLTCDWKGKTVASTASTTAAVIDTLITFPKSLVSVSIGGTAADEIQEAKITFGKTVELAHGVGSNLAQQGKATELKFAFTAKLGFQDKTWQELGIGGASPPNAADPSGIEFEIDADNGTALGSGKRQFKCTLENCQFNKTEIVASIGGLVFLDLAGVGTIKECFSVDDISSGSW